MPPVRIFITRGLGKQPKLWRAWPCWGQLDESSRGKWGSSNLTGSELLHAVSARFRDVEVAVAVEAEPVRDVELARRPDHVVLDVGGQAVGAAPGLEAAAVGPELYD